MALIFAGLALAVHPAQGAAQDDSANSAGARPAGSAAALEASSPDRAPAAGSLKPATTAPAQAGCEDTSRPRADSAGAATPTPASNAPAPAGLPAPAPAAARSPQTGKTGKDSAVARGKKKKFLRGNAPCLAWIDPDKQPRAVLLCVHGLGLHNGTYEAFGKRMAREGIATYAIDVRGFGSWMEAKGRERVDFDGCLDDLTATLRVIHRAHAGLPVFVLGESMGGAIALRETAQHPELIAGLISSVPAGDRFQQKRTALKVALHLLEGPNKPFNVGEDVIKQATEKPELRAAWENDPLARMNLSPRELMQFQSFMNENHQSASEIKSTPVLLVQGCNDRLVRPEGTVELYNELATPDKQLALIQYAEHLVFEESQFTDGQVKLVVDWVDAHLPKQQESASAEPGQK